MKKILYVTNITRNINAFFIPHLNMLIDEGNIVDCACKISGEHKIKKEKLRDGIKFFDIPVTRNPLNSKNLKSFYKLYKIQKKEQYDIIHVHSPIIGIYTRLLKIFYPNLKMIYTAHGFHFHKNSSKISWIIFYNIEKFASRFTDILVTINEEDYQVAKSFKQKQLIKINGVGVDLEEFPIIDDKNKIKEIRNSIGIKESDFIFIMVGEHNKNKNQIQLIKAMELLQNEYPNLKALFIGDGIDIEKNKKYIKENNINNCIILGFRNDVSDLINISDVLVSLSYREGLPKNVLEALAVGKIILGTNTRGIKDLVKGNGFLVECNDIKETKNKIERIYMKTNVEKNKMIEKSLEISKEYTYDYIKKDLKSIY